MENKIFRIFLKKSSYFERDKRYCNFIIYENIKINTIFFIKKDIEKCDALSPIQNILNSARQR